MMLLQVVGVQIELSMETQCIYLSMVKNELNSNPCTILFALRFGILAFFMCRFQLNVSFNEIIEVMNVGGSICA